MRALRTRILATTTLRDIILDIVRGLAYVHSKTDDVNDNISHRDVKPENIVIVPNERDGKIAAKLTDFDSSKQLDVDVSVNITTAAAIFTELYKAPDLTRAQKARIRVMARIYLGGDTYALAIVIYQLLTGGAHPFEGDNDIATLHNMMNNVRTILIGSPIDELAKNAIWTMTQPETSDRISLDQVLRLPYFQDPSDHIQAINALNEALIELNAGIEADRIIKDALNESFFMLFRCKWQSLPFVVPDVLRRSKYSDSVIDFFRFCRNLLVHAGQLKDLLEKHFGKSVSDLDLLEMILECVPRILVHAFWFAKSYIQHLKFAAEFPSQCVKAYEELMHHVRAEIGDQFEELQSAICGEAKRPTAGADQDEIMLELFQQSHHEIIQIVKKTDPEFKAYKSSLKSLEHEKHRLEETLSKLKLHERPADDVDLAQEKLDTVTQKLEGMWLLRAREILRDPKKLKEGRFNPRLYP